MKGRFTTFVTCFYNARRFILFIPISFCHPHLLTMHTIHLSLTYISLVVIVMWCDITCCFILYYEYRPVTIWSLGSPSHPSKVKFAFHSIPVFLSKYRQALADLFTRKSSGWINTQVHFWVLNKLLFNSGFILKQIKHFVSTERYLKKMRRKEMKMKISSILFKCWKGTNRFLVIHEILRN